MTDYSVFAWIGAIIAILFIVAILLIPFFIWDMRNAALRSARALERIEKLLESDSRVVRNIDANMAHAAGTLQDIRDGNQDA